MVDDRIYLVFPVLALVLLGIAGAWLFVKRRSPRGSRERGLVAVAGVAFVFLGTGILNTFAILPPAVAIPLLAFVAVLGGTSYLGLSQPWRVHRAPREQPSPPQVSKDRDVGSPKREPRGPLIFISYRRNDSSDVTGRIYDRLVEQFGRDRIFKDVDSMPLGVDYRKHLADGVSQCRIVLAIIGRSWMSERGLASARDFVRIEIESAFQHGIPIIPVLVQGANVPAEEDLPPTLQPLAYQHGISIRPDPDFHQDMDRLVRGIEAHTAEMR